MPKGGGMPPRPKGGNPGGGPPGNPPGFGPRFGVCSMGFEDAWPASAYEEVMESMTLCAFSWPICW